MNRKAKIVLIVLGIVVIASGFFYGGYLYLKKYALAEPLTGEQASKAIQELQPIADNFFTGFAANDHEMAAKDFTTRMNQTLNPSSFVTLRSRVYDRVGALLSLGTPKVSRIGPETILAYTAAFEKESGVEVKLVFSQQPTLEYKISGLWFTSPKLREE